MTPKNRRNEKSNNFLAFVKFSVNTVRTFLNMASRNIPRVTSPRQLADQKQLVEYLKKIGVQRAQQGYPGPSANEIRNADPNATTTPVVMKGGGYGSGGRQPMYRFAPRQPREHKPLALAETGSQVIKRQGGLSPSYGPSGINDTYKQGPVGAWQKLQNSMAMAKSGRPADADKIERADQLQGMNMAGAQDLRNDVNFNTAVLGNQANDTFTPPLDAQAQAANAATAWQNPEQFNPYSTENGMNSAYNPENEQDVMAAAKGGNVTGKAVVGEAGPETKFNKDGSIDQFNKPTLLNNAKPGIIVPNPELKKFLGKFNHPPKDTVGVTPAFGMGGSLSIPEIGSTYGPQPEVIGMSARGANAIGGNSWLGAAPTPELTDEDYYAMGMLPPSRGGRGAFEIPAQQGGIGAFGLPAFADGGSYDSNAFENNPENFRTDAQGNTWMRNPDKPDSGILVLRAPQPVNQPMRRFLQSWEDPNNSGIVQDVDAYAQNLAELQAQTAQELQTPALRTPGAISSKYGTGSVAQTAQPSMIEGLPSDEYFQRQANRGGANKFAQPEADSAYASAQRPKASKAPSLAQTNPALFAQFENWRNSIKRGRI